MKRQIVTLTTDWGEQGFFAGMVKGALLSLVEEVQVVDISHKLASFNIMTASFAVRHGCLGFPEGTVHIIDVASQQPFIALRFHGQYYICSDNGLPALVFGNEVEECVDIPVQENGIYNFAAYNLFVPVAARLLKGASLSDIGPRHPQLKQRPLATFLQQGEFYRIYVHYVDSYGNVYLGMSYREFEELRHGRPFVMQVKEMTVSKVTSSYQQSDGGEFNLLLTVSSTGQLELALQNHDLARFSGLKANDSVLLRFKG